MEEDYRHDRQKDILLDRVNQLDFLEEVPFPSNEYRGQLKMPGDLCQRIKMREVVKRNLTPLEELLKMKIQTQASLPDGKMIDLPTFWLLWFGNQPVLEGDIFYVRR